MGRTPWTGMTPEQAATVWDYRLVRETRRRRNLTQREIGRLIGVATSTGVTNWERGIRLPSLTHFKGLCEVLALEPGVVLGLRAGPGVPEFEVRYRVVGRGVNGEVVQAEGVAQPIESS